MSVSLSQMTRIGAYLMGKKVRGVRRFPLVLMLEPLFACNLACAGCGKIARDPETLKKRMPVEDALQAVDACGAPVVTVTGGEPFLHPDLVRLVQEILARRRFVYLCTNGLLLEEHVDELPRSKDLTLSVHLDGKGEAHDRSVCKEGAFDKAVAGIRRALSLGLRVMVNSTLYNGLCVEDVVELFDFATDLGVTGITVSPGYSYEGASRQDVFLQQEESQRLFREVFKRGREKGRKWQFNQSVLFLDFLAGNQTYDCSPWSCPTYNVLGWQRPCYLLADAGYASTFEELMNTTDWSCYGVGKNEKCGNCMAHCGYEGAAVSDTFSHPFKALGVARRGPGR